MRQMISRSGMPWSRADLERLRTLIRAKTPATLISAMLGRTPAAIASKASALGLSLRPSSSA
jgi:hypothetical protein